MTTTAAAAAAAAAAANPPSIRLSEPSSTQQQRDDKQPRTHIHIFMITGNPGCVGYYTEFLSLLWDELRDVRRRVDVSIYGASMSGFADDDDKRRPVLGLREQIAFVEEKLRGEVAGRQGVRNRVVLVGHSVGAYIGMEILRKRELSAGCEVLGLVGLWPTLTYIAQSKRGRRVGWLLRFPGFAFVVGMIARVVFSMLGAAVVVAILRFMDFPENAAHVTAEFLMSRNGVYQALYMAGDEMREITSDEWNEDLWGAISQPSSKPKPKIVLCFGNNDHWVADHYRDELIKTSGRHPDKQWLPEMVIDETGIPHSFCIHHSKPVAQRTAVWITNMIDGSP